MGTVFIEFESVPSIRFCAHALAEYAIDIGGVAFQREGGRWVARPHNFVTLKVQFARSGDVVMTLRGAPFEFERRADLILRADRNGYSRCNLNSPKQLLSAASYIARALELYKRGAGRPATRPVTTEI